MDSFVKSNSVFRIPEVCSTVVTTASACPGPLTRGPPAAFVKEACAIVGGRRRCRPSTRAWRRTPHAPTRSLAADQPEQPVGLSRAGQRHVAVRAPGPGRCRHCGWPSSPRPAFTAAATEPFARGSDVSRDPVGCRGGGHPAEPHEHRLRPGADHARPEHLVSDRPPARAGRARRAGGLGPNGYSFMGALRDAPRIESETGPEVGRRLAEEGVDAALVTPT